MTQSHSKSRQAAEVAFNNLQVPFYAKNHAVDELEAIVRSRDAKTQRLREARLAKALADRTAATIALHAKRSLLR